MDWIQAIPLWTTDPSLLRDGNFADVKTQWRKGTKITPRDTQPQTDETVMMKYQMETWEPSSHLLQTFIC